MGLSPYVALLASGAVAQGAGLTDTYDVPTRGRAGLILSHDISAIGVGHSFVTSADITLPVVVDATHDQFGFGGATTHDFLVAHGSYATIAALVAALVAATKDEDNVGGSFASLVTVSADPNGTGLRFTSVASGVNTTAFSTGVENDLLANLGITNGWTIAHTEAAGADASCSVVIDVCGKDEASGKFYSILTGAAQTSVSTKVLQVHPGMVASANLIAESQLPANIRVVVTRATDDSYTRTLGIQLTA